MTVTEKIIPAIMRLLCTRTEKNNASIMSSGKEGKEIYEIMSVLTRKNKPSIKRNSYIPISLQLSLDLQILWLMAF